MDFKGKNTILITGGGSGIGAALAAAFHELGNTVIIAGRRKEMLDAVIAKHPGMSSQLIDLQDPAKLRDFARDLTSKYPELNGLIHMAGIMKPEDLLGAPDPTTIDRTIATNLIAPLQLTAELLPHLLRQPEAVIMTVTSGLAFTPLASTPTYCATKAAMHSWTMSLRYQLKNTPVKVLELVPPYVQTELLGAHQATDPRAMPLPDYMDEVMGILSSQPDVKEILVRNVYPLRFAGDFNADKFDSFYEQFNAAMASH